jgi:pimeloyl-ACP methyl ester carboxylesterase
VPETRYARCGDLSLAYQVFGSGDVDIVVSGSFVSNVEVFWTSPEFTSFFEHLASFARVLIYDKAGVGLSDPVIKVRTVEERAEEIEAVMDAAGFARAALFGLSEGGPASMVFAAAHPNRTRALVLMGTYAMMPIPFDGAWEELVDRDPSQLRQLVTDAMGEKYSLELAQVRRFQALGRGIRDAWGTGAAMAQFTPSIRSRQQLGMIERVSASPGMARATVAALSGMDIRAILPVLDVPTLIIHATDDIVPVQLGRYLADHIPGARMLEVAGHDHAPWLTQPEVTIDAIEEFLTGEHAHQPGRRALRTLLFTDIVGSTDRAVAVGDDRWHALLQRFDEIARDTVERFDGRVIKSTGDGHLVTVDGPAQAIRCAEALNSAVEPLDIELRCGVHTGECELLGHDLGGIGVHIAARIMGQAAPGEILVSSTVRDLVVGSGLGFEDRGTHSLKGVPGEWQLLAVRRGGASATSPEGLLAAQPTPPMRTGMRRSDRAMSAVARRAPGLMRGMARLAKPKERAAADPGRAAS